MRLFAFAGKDRPFTPDAYFDAVKKGHTFVSNGPMLDLRIGDAMPGDRVEVDGDQKLRIEARAWGLAGESAPAELRIVRLGETLIQKTSPADGASSVTELVVDESIPAGHGFWVAAHARGRNGSEAHTTPIYVTRKGFRHWNVDKVKALVDQRLQNLADIESIVTLAEKNARNQPAGSINYWDKRAADQAAPVRERVNKMRDVYKGLLKELDGEMGRRKAGK